MGLGRASPRAQLSEQIRKTTNVDPLVPALAALVLGLVYQYLQDADTSIKRYPRDQRGRRLVERTLMAAVGRGHSRKQLHEIIVNLIGLDPFLSRLQYLRDAPALKAEIDLTAVRTALGLTHAHWHLQTLTGVCLRCFAG